MRLSFGSTFVTLLLAVAFAQGAPFHPHSATPSVAISPRGGENFLQAGVDLASSVGSIGYDHTKMALGKVASTMWVEGTTVLRKAVVGAFGLTDNSLQWVLDSIEHEGMKSVAPDLIDAAYAAGEYNPRSRDLFIELRNAAMGRFNSASGPTGDDVVLFKVLAQNDDPEVVEELRIWASTLSDEMRKELELDGDFTIRHRELKKTGKIAAGAVAGVGAVAAGGAGLGGVAVMASDSQVQSQVIEPDTQPEPAQQQGDVMSNANAGWTQVSPEEAAAEYSDSEESSSGSDSESDDAPVAWQGYTNHWLPTQAMGSR